MGSKFLNGGASDLASLQDGTFPLNVASAIVQNLAPSLPVKTTVGNFFRDENACHR